MRVLFVTLPRRERLFNLVPVGWALRAAGHEVQIASEPDFAATIVRTGIVAVAMEDAPARMSVADQGVVDALVEYTGLWLPDLIVWDECTLVGAVAARAAGVPSARIRTGADPVVVASGFAELAGLPGMDLNKGVRTFNPLPPSMRSSVTHGDHHLRFVPYGGPSIVPAWLRRPPKRPRLCVIGDGHVPLGALLEAAADHDADVISSADIEQLPPGSVVPDNVRLVDAMAWNGLLPSCTAVVHGGGPSVTLSALSYGLPQLIVNGGHGGFGRRLESLGAGLTVEPDQKHTFSERLHRLATEDGLRVCAGRIGEEMAAAPSPADIVPELLAVATGH